MKLLTKAVLSACLSLMLAFVLVANQAQAKTYTLRVGTYEPERLDIVQKVYLPYCKEIERRTNGKVKFKWYFAGSLVKPGQTVKALESGLADIVPSVAIWRNENLFPVSRVFTLPFMFESGAQVDRTYYKAVETIPAFKKEYASIKMLGYHSTDFSIYAMVVPPPKTQAEMKGLKIWAGSRTLVQMTKLLGATPRNIKLGDLYMSLQRKAIDGVAFPIAPLAAYKLTDVVNNHTVMMGPGGLIPFAMSMKTWKKLPPDIQAVFQEMIPSTSAFLGSVIDQKRADILRQLKTRGDNIYMLPADEKARWRKTMQPIYDGWLKDMKSKGIDGQSVLNQVVKIANEMKSTPVKPQAWWGDWKK
ncbi:MAG: TRAP transporter substrate-binding protein DctP [Deltaproteobacteria bacterium]|jgi:TRAP-type C4-dicarboxylate transport system substrate-binding protein|nr:TRAP transporter substrate-binding protein DctP [Deltaproteobacteria bacterium]MBT4637190.1 TRAP transporter substrate-binding protein DctP [Deltaproteobacteria bacterium]MBT6500551.1 TRAP transporter substrate-binding protein DctP [Deltaproteobacteria bacterium]